MGGGTNIQSKLSFSDTNSYRRLGLNQWNPCAEVTTGLLKTPRKQLTKRGKNDTALIPILNTFNITTFPHLEHRSNMTEYSYTKALETEMQRHVKAYVATSKLPVRMPIVLPMRK